MKLLGGGRFKVLTTSTPHLILRAHSPGIHTFDFRNLKFKMPSKATQNPGFTWTGEPHGGVELLMRVVERTGRPYHFHLPG